ncbi:MAG: uncharacterized protein JWR82_641 [Blastococcus sp.]|jgi:hypothetical protein|nr:uncharacterized protein [Blastococcus sp.]
MHIRRPIAALLTALALVGGGSATLSACGGDPAGLDRNDGTSDDSSNTSGSDPGSDEQGNLPDNSNPDPNNEEDSTDDTTDPD